MLQKYDISAIILAGGKSQRMGQDKRMIKLKNSGLKLWEHAVKLAEPLVKEVLIIANPEEIKHPKHRVIKDIIPDIGPLGGIYTGLLNIKTSHALVLPVDMPLLNHNVLQRLLTHISGKQQIIIARHNNQIEPLVGIYPESAVPDINEMIKTKKYKIQMLYRLLETTFVDFDDNQCFLNLNYQKDLKELDLLISQSE